MSDSVRVTRGQDQWQSETMLENSSVGNNRAKFAAGFIEKFGCIAYMPDGEDTSGRQKLRLATPEEMVDRACDTAELLYERFEWLGWLTEVPESAVDEPEDEQAR